MPSNFYGYLRHGTCGSKDCSNFEQKQCRMNIAQKMFNDDTDVLKKFITGDKSRVYGYDIETKVQSSQWKRTEEPRPKNVCQVRSNVKVLLTVFFNCNGVVHHEYYLESMRRLREAIHQKLTEL